MTPALVWTTDPPNREGFWWAKDTDTFWVVEFTDGELFLPGIEEPCETSEFSHFAWPIPEPREP